MNTRKKAVLRFLGVLLAGLSIAAGCEGNLNDADEAFVTTSRGSQSAAGVQGDALCASDSPMSPAVEGSTSLSNDGGLVAFASDATNLVAGDTNGQRDIFVKDLNSGAIRRANRNDSDVEGSGTSTSNGADAGNAGGCSNPQITPDGRFVVFESNQTNLVSGDTNTLQDIFVRNLEAGTTARASVTTTGAQVPHPGGMVLVQAGKHPSISEDGRFVAFESTLPLDSTDTNSRSDIYLWDRNAGTTRLVGLRSGGAKSTTGTTGSTKPRISGDGTLISFTSDYTDLLSSPADTNSTDDVYVCETSTGRTVDRASLTTAGTQGTASSDAAVLSRHGRYVAFASSAPEFPAGGGGITQVYLRDRTAGTLVAVSVDTRGVKGSASSFTPAISADGLMVAFVSQAANLVDGDSNSADDIFVRNLAAGTTTRVSVNTFNEESQGAQYVSGFDVKQKGSSTPSLSADGRFVAVVSEATNLVVGDSNAVADVFVRGPLR